MSNKNEELIKAAYALNLWTVSVSQIIDYNDINILEQEYDTIMNNLNLEKMPKDETLLDVIKNIMDEITTLKIEYGDQCVIESEYRHRIKNAIWNAVPNIAAIFTTPDPRAVALTLATQIGIGYMNYRRNKAEYDLKYQKAKWEIQRNRMQHLNGLQQQLFETAWRLADKYCFPDSYRLAPKQISEYNKILTETNPVKRFNSLNAISANFEAYPIFWYQIASTANSIYRSDLYNNDADNKEKYREYAIDSFKKYRELNTLNLLRNDVLAASGALEYFELLNFADGNNISEAKDLLQIAEQYAGGAKDVLELCAFSYLRIKDYDNATRLFHNLVNAGYNIGINTQILSGLYIKAMRSEDLEKAKAAKMSYNELPNITEPKFILSIPDESVDINQWNAPWNKTNSEDEDKEELLEKQRKVKIKVEESKKLAWLFYQKPPIVIVFDDDYEEIANYFLQVLNESRNNVRGITTPAPVLCKHSEYKKNRENYERNGYRIYFIGESKEAKKLYKSLDKWDMEELGLKYVTLGNKIVLIAEELENDFINEFISLARKINKKHSVKIPEGVETAKLTFLKEILEDMGEDTTARVISILTMVIMSPLIAAGQMLDTLTYGKQKVINFFKRKDLVLLQYCVLIYMYLDRQNALPIDESKLLMDEMTAKDDDLNNASGDIRFDLSLTKEEAATGIIKEIALYLDCKCEACKGTGLNSNNSQEGCRECHGKGVVKKQENIKVRSPAGVTDGSRLKVIKKGKYNKNTESRGDLYIVCFIKE